MEGYGKQTSVGTVNIISISQSTIIQDILIQNYLVGNERDGNSISQAMAPAIFQVKGIQAEKN